MNAMAAYENPQPEQTVTCEHCGTLVAVHASRTPTRAVTCPHCARSVPVPMHRQTFIRSPRSEESR